MHRSATDLLAMGALAPLLTSEAEETPAPPEAATSVLRLERHYIRPLLRAESVREYYQLLERFWHDTETLSAVFEGLSEDGKKIDPKPDRQAFLRRTENRLQRAFYLRPDTKEHFRTGLRALRRMWSFDQTEQARKIEFTSDQIRLLMWNDLVVFVALSIAVGDRPACDEVSEEIGLTFANVASAVADALTSLAGGTPLDEESLEDAFMFERLRRERVLRPEDFDVEETIDQFSQRHGLQ